MDGPVAGHNGIKDGNAGIWKPVSGKNIMGLDFHDKKWHGRAPGIPKEGPWRGMDGIKGYI